MTSTTLDQVDGFSGSRALKEPVRLATTADIALEGLLTIDGTVTAEGDRVLVKDQATPSQNGIYIASSGVWSRAVDMDTTGKVVKGTQVWVTDGVSQPGNLWIVDAENPITLGTSLLTWQIGSFYQAAAAMAVAIAGATTKTTPAAADQFGYVNNADGTLRKFSWTQMLAALAVSFLPLAGGTLTGQLNGTGVGGSHLTAPDSSFGITLAGSFGGGLLLKDGAGRGAVFMTSSGAQLNLAAGGTAAGIAAQLQVVADGLVLAGTAKGIKFPATQNPSTDPNTLDDYEEGTWTPVMRFGGASVGVTYTTQLGQYTKVGNVCHIQGNITLSAKGSSTGAASIGGLPFAAGGPDTSWRSGINAGHMNAATWASLTAGLNLNVAGTETFISIRVPGTTGQAGNATEGNATNTSSLGFGGTYITA
ncbi:MAG TPA: hypothetical protein VGE73_06455 [Pseudolabrys sp.]